MFRLLVVLFLVFPGLVNASNELNVAVLDVNYIIQNALATKQLNKQLEAKRKKLEISFSEKEKDLRQKDKSLSEQRSILSTEAFEVKMNEFKSEVMKVQREVQEKNLAVDKAYSAASEAIGAKIDEVTNNIVLEKGIDLALPMLPRPYITYKSGKVNDISVDVLNALDKIMPSIELEIQ